MNEVDIANPLQAQLDDLKAATEALAKHRLDLKTIQARRNEIAAAAEETAFRAAKQAITADLTLEAIKSHALSQAAAAIELQTLEGVLAELDASIAKAVRDEAAPRSWVSDAKTAAWVKLLNHAVSMIPTEAKQALTAAMFMASKRDSDVVALIRGSETQIGVSADLIEAVELAWGIPA